MGIVNAEVRVEWFGQRVWQTVDRSMHNRMRKVGAHVANKIRKNISVRVVKLGGGRKIRSLPGEYPRQETGRLKQSINWTIRETPTGKELRVWAARPYTEFLELGTRKMSPRPFLSRTVREEMPTIRRMMLEPFKPSETAVSGGGVTRFVTKILGKVARRIFG